MCRQCCRAAGCQGEGPADLTMGWVEGWSWPTGCNLDTLDIQPTHSTYSVADVGVSLSYIQFFRRLESRWIFGRGSSLKTPQKGEGMGRPEQASATEGRARLYMESDWKCLSQHSIQGTRLGRGKLKSNQWNWGRRQFDFGGF